MTDLDRAARRAPVVRDADVRRGRIGTRVIMVPPWSRTWWSLWHRDIAAGRPTGFISIRASRGIGRAVAEAEMPGWLERGALVAVEIGSPAFAAWCEFYSNRGVQLPRPSRAPVVWLPGYAPPSSSSGEAA